jgi:hypothetical protein
MVEIVEANRVDRLSLAWLLDRREPRGTSGFAFYAPPRFETYFRVLHPARLPIHGGYRDVSWQEMAEVLGTELSATTSIFDLLRIRHIPAYEGLHEYCESTPTPQLTRRLVNVMRALSSYPLCFVGFDNAWGQSLPVLSLSTTETFLDSQYRFAEVSYLTIEQFSVFPTLWWPPDCAWMMVSPTDVYSSLLGCSAAIASQLRTAGVEMLPIQPTDPVVIDRGMTKDGQSD